MSKASCFASSAVRTGERFGPILTRPPSGHQPASTSIATRIGADGSPAAASIRSRWAALSTIITGARSGSASVSAASRRIAVRSVLG